MMHAVLSVDLSVLRYLYSIRTMPLTYFFIDVSEFGRWQIVSGIAVLLSLFAVLHRRYADVAGIFAAVLGSGGIILFLKYTIQRPRPEWWYQAYPEGPYYSFPSAHAGLSMALYGFCIYLLLQSAPGRLRHVVIALLPLLIFLVGFSRLYLGVHYLSDVIAGFVIGVLAVIFAIQTRLRLLTR
jgi:membrane-associated phospholipid phosphatase